VLAVVTGLSASDDVPSLQNLVGSREAAIDSVSELGNSYVRTEKFSDGAYSYWREEENGSCVGVSIESSETVQTTYSTSESETNFIFDGKTYFNISNKTAAKLEYEKVRDWANSTFRLAAPGPETGSANPNEKRRGLVEKVNYGR
jgi:hypothetical protein